MSASDTLHLKTAGRFQSVINDAEFIDLVKVCSESPLFSHRYSDALIKLLAAHSIDDPDLLLLAQIAAEMGVADTSLVHPDLEGSDCEVSDAYSEEEAVYGEAKAILGAAPKPVADREWSKHRRPKVSVYKISGEGLHVGFYRNLPTVVRKVGGRIESPYKVLPINHQIINLMGGISGELLDSSVKVVKNAVFVGDSFAYTNYAHWTLDWFPRLKWIIEEHCDAAMLTIVFHRKPSAFHFEMLESIGFKRENIIHPEASTPTFFVKAETVYATNIGRDFRHSFHAGASWAIDFLREKLSDDKKSPFSPGVRLVVTRPSRGIIFSDDAVSVLKDKGFIFVRLEHMDYKTQVALFANASAVLAPHGAGLSNLVFCKPGAHVLEVFNGSYGTHAFYTVAHFGGLDYSCVVGEPDDDSGSTRPIDMNCHIGKEAVSKWLTESGI